MAQEQRNALPRGYELDGYRFESVLGAGGFGITYKALELGLKRTVAIKEYLPGGLAMRARDGVSVHAVASADESDFDWGLDRSRYPLIERGVAWLRSNAPAEGSTALCWGDSRLANQIFDGLECVAVIDWEMARIGLQMKQCEILPPEHTLDVDNLASQTLARALASIDG